MLTDKDQQQDTAKLLARISQLEAENRELRQQNEMLRSQLNLILQHVPLLYFRVNKEGIFLDIQGKGLSLLAHTAEEVKGMSAFDMGKRWPDLGLAVQEALKGKSFAQTLYTADGHAYEAFQLPINDQDGQPDGFIGVAYDITPYVKEEKRSNYKDSFLRFFVKHTPAAIAMFDRDMRYIMYSDRWIEDYRLQDKEEELLGKSHYEVFPDTPKRWREVHQRCLRGVTESYEEDRYERGDGTVDYVNWVVTPWYTEKNEVGGLIFFTELVNEKVEAHARQKAMSKAIKDSHRRMEEFVYAVSQNLRDPLESALILVDYIREHLHAPLPESLPRTANFLRTHLARITRMVDELREYASSNKQVGKSYIELSDIIEQVLTNLVGQIPDGQAEFIYQDLPRIRANEFEMIALFQHLLSNAIRYYQGEALQVEIKAQEQENHWLISVKDNGPGMSKQAQEEVFDLFRQLDADQSLTGSGISLPMSRRIVERMGGQIWVESEMGEGSIFWISLPKEQHQE